MSLVACCAINTSALINKLSVAQIDHMINVGVYAGVLAKKINDYKIFSNSFSQRDIELVSEAAYYHDIGKVWIPHNIRYKTGKLTAEENLQIKQHTLLALKLFNYIHGKVILGMPDYLVPLACDAAVYHHERWDGSGNPFGMQGKKIPLIARITAICDYYDKETVQWGNSHRAACSNIKKKAGTYFDPMLTGVFIQYHSEFEMALHKIRDSFNI